MCTAPQNRTPHNSIQSAYIVRSASLAQTCACVCVVRALFVARYCARGATHHACDPESQRARAPASQRFYVRTQVLTPSFCFALTSASGVRASSIAHRTIYFHLNSTRRRQLNTHIHTNTTNIMRTCTRSPQPPPPPIVHALSSRAQL